MMNKDTLDRIESWLTDTFDSDTQQIIIDTLGKNSTELQESFYKDLEFGTGGMRGIMGVGTNRINKYTLGKSTQGLSDYLYQSFPNEPIKAVIAYDCRNNSKELALFILELKFQSISH